MLTGHRSAGNAVWTIYHKGVCGVDHIVISGCNHLILYALAGHKPVGISSFDVLPHSIYLGRMQERKLGGGGEMNQSTGLQANVQRWMSCVLAAVVASMCCASAGHGQSSRMAVTSTGVPAQATVAESGDQANKLKGRSANPRGKFKVGPPKSGPKVANPFAAQKSAAILMQLDQQRKAADKEASEMKLGLRTAQTGTLLASPSPNPNSTSTHGTQTTAPARTPAVQAPPSPPGQRTNVGAVAQSPARSTLLKPAGPGAIGPEKTTGSGTGSRAILTAPDPVNTLALTCAHDPTMKILNVSGSYYPATFTTIRKYDAYTITGCSFGDPGPNAKVYLYKDLYKGTGFPLQFQILEWHDNWIHLQLDWNLTGLFDQDNLTLVVQRADGKQASKGGYKFYAAREEVMLRSIPRQHFSLWGLTATNTSKWTVTYNSPASTTDEMGFQGMTAEAQWDEAIPFMKSNFDTAHAPSGGRDVYDFSRLQPGFVPTNAYLQWQDADCSYASGTLVTVGNFNLEWQSASLWVDWQGQSCQNMRCGGITQGDCFAVPNTNYGLDVWVEGPRGIDPWTGLPTKK